VHHPKQFRSSQPARLCAKDVYALLEQLRSNAQENQGELPFDTGDSSEATTTVQVQE
jgi:hypothetical protein